VTIGVDALGTRPGGFPGSIGAMSTSEPAAAADPDPAEDASDSPPADATLTATKPRRRRWALRIALIVVIALAVLVSGGAVTGYLYLRSVDSKIQRVEVFTDIPDAMRPSKVPMALNAVNYLILGSDSEDPTSSRSDTMILMHVNKDHTGAQLVSIPRDTWVHIPRSPDGRYGNTNAKINAAYAWGGVPLTVETVEGFTGVRIDHVIMVDYAGFKEIIDALGGVEITVDQAFTSTHSLNANSIRHFNAGPQVMDGAAALDYSRERFAFADGDFARIRHQQQVIKAILDKAATSDLLVDPVRLNSFLTATAKAVIVDSTLDIFGTAADLRHLRSGNLSFYTSPSAGTGMEGSQSVVYPDLATDRTVYDAIRQDLPLPAFAPPHL
jgi:LCP family protein required for cell wall assembly